MLFPIDDLLDDAACYRLLLRVLHPDGLHCPLGHALEEGQAPHDRHLEPIVDDRCRRTRTPTRCDVQAPPPLPPPSPAGETPASRHVVAPPRSSRPRSSRASTATHSEMLPATARAVRPVVTPCGPCGHGPRGPCCRRTHCVPGGCDTRAPIRTDGLAPDPARTRGSSDAIRANPAPRGEPRGGGEVMREAVTPFATSRRNHSGRCVGQRRSVNADSYPGSSVPKSRSHTREKRP
jgi:hypothetical protein